MVNIRAIRLRIKHIRIGSQGIIAIRIPRTGAVQPAPRQADTLPVGVVRLTFQTRNFKIFSDAVKVILLRRGQNTCADRVTDFLKQFIPDPEDVITACLCLYCGVTGLPGRRY